MRVPLQRLKSRPKPETPALWQHAPNEARVDGLDLDELTAGRMVAHVFGCLERVASGWFAPSPGPAGPPEGRGGDLSRRLPGVRVGSHLGSYN